MTGLTPALHRTIVVVDVAGFTDPARHDTDQFAVRQGMYDALMIAFAESGIDLDSCEREDRGDGALILVPPTVPKSVMADRLPDRLVAALRRYNATRVPQAQFKLRMALHSGDVRPDENGWVGPAINLAFRILDAPEAEAALRDDDPVVALIVSEHFYTEVIQQDPDTVPESYRQITVSVKTFIGSARLRLLGHEMTASSPLESAVYEQVLDMWPPEELRALRSWLSHYEIPRLSVLMSHATESAIPLPGGEEVHDAWDTFQYLSELNAGPDGMPPSMVFVEQLADELGGDTGDTIRNWVNTQARRLRLGTALEEYRRTHVGTTPAADVEPLSWARVRLHSSDTVRVGEPVEVDFAFIRTDRSVEPLTAPASRLRVLLHASNASVRPLSHVVELEPNRTTRAVRFQVTPDSQGALTLIFRVYLARSGQLLQEVRAQLPVHAHVTAGAT